MASPPERPRTDYGSAGVDADAVEAGLAGLVRHVRATWPDADSGLGAIKVGLGYSRASSISAASAWPSAPMGSAPRR